MCSSGILLAARAGRRLEDIELCAGGTVGFSDDVEKLVASRKPYLAFTLGLNFVALLAVIWLFNSRWRVSDTH